MKIGLISDVHADLNGLTCALDLLHGRGVDHIICAGDLVEKGEDGDAVVKRIREENIPCVLGNHDEMAPGNQSWLRDYGDPTHPAMKGRMLSDETLAFLKSLPMTRGFTFGEVSLLLAHGSPFSNTRYIFANSPELILRGILEDCGVDVIVLGHTHQPMWIKVGEGWIFNPGSTNGWEGNTCAILHLPAMKFEVFDVQTCNPVKPDYRVCEF